MGFPTRQPAPDLFLAPEDEAQRVILSLADHLYANTALKPMSKALFAISRFLLLVRELDLRAEYDPAVLKDAYRRASRRLSAPLADDFSFGDIVHQCRSALPRVIGDLSTVVRLVHGRDALGLVFSSLVRGRWDSGEGMGTFLTPEEVVDAIVAMVLTRNRAVSCGPRASRYIGDICGGTGRFPLALAQALCRSSNEVRQPPASVVSFDQSTLASDYARLNFHFMGLTARCDVVADSLLDRRVSSLKSRCSALATNPPFGAGKYEVTPTLLRELPRSVAADMTMSPTVDPAPLFLFRNLDLLCTRGVLGIVLPDGVIQAPQLVKALKAYERDQQFAVEVRALVSLPPVTFAFGGTVAKTSFLIVSKEDAPTNRPMFMAHANHIGFLKRRNTRISDKEGNDLPMIVSAYGDHRETDANWVPNWRCWSRLGLSLIQETNGGPQGIQLQDLANGIRRFTTVVPGPASFHVSVLDVDETGLIDVLSAQRNCPSTRVLSCKPGDVLVSCINPRIWRVAVVPSLRGRWTCSSEFLVLRPKSDSSSWKLALRLHQGVFVNAIRSMAGGTSSSRQRVKKEDVLSVAVPEVALANKVIEAHGKARDKYYSARLAEGALYEQLGRNGYGVGSHGPKDSIDSARKSIR